MPTDSEIQVTGADAQVTVKNRWPDGSVKFAVIAGRAKLIATVPTTVTLSRGASLKGPGLTTETLRATGLTAVIAVEGIGSVSWSENDFDAPFQNWILGPRMSSFVYRKSIPGDAHLTAWLEVRVFEGGAVEVLPWVENGYLNVPGPTNKNVTFRFVLAGKEKFNQTINLYHHARTPLIAGTMLSYWLGNDPEVVPHHDVTYMQATELVPSYRAVSDPALTSYLTPAYTPLQAGGFRYDGDAMPSSGYQSPIGLLPSHDMLYLTCPEPCPVFESIVRNGYSAGRYPIHYRDEKTQRPLRFSEYPTLVIADGCGFKDSGASTTGFTPACSGGGPAWDTAHSPSVGYMPYLLTGRWYFMEETQFAATANFLGLTNTAVMRNGSLGILHPVVGAFQSRASAWAVRALIQALTVTPDDDTTMRGEFKNSWEANIDFFYNRYIAKPHNPFGIVEPGGVYDDRGQAVSAPWMEDFITAIWGYAVSLDLPVSDVHSQRTKEFFQWKARSVVGRLGLPSEFWFVNAAPYLLVVSPSTKPDWVGGTGPWYSSWKEVYDATYATPPTWISSTDGVLGGEYGIDEWGRSMWGNLQPAIAYAVRHRVPGASEAYDRMIHAKNWAEMSATFNAYPVWSIKPAR